MRELVDKICENRFYGQDTREIKCSNPTHQCETDIFLLQKESWS